jgi:hypothetical protein
MRTPLHEVKNCTYNKAGDVFTTFATAHAKNIAPVLDSTLFQPTTRKKDGRQNDVKMMNAKSLAKTLCFGGCRPMGKPRGRQDDAFWRDT